MTKSLYHLTINTGHARESPRAEVPDWAIAKLMPVVKGGGGALGVPGWHLDILHRLDGGAIWQIGPGGQFEPWVICATCWNPQYSDQAWANLMRLVTAMGMPAGAAPNTDMPWLAVMMLPSMQGLPMDDVFAMGDAERCIAWTLIESDGTKP